MHFYVAVAVSGRRTSLLHAVRKFRFSVCIVPLLSVSCQLVLKFLDFISDVGIVRVHIVLAVITHFRKTK
jgi:hypothetical protein